MTATLTRPSLADIEAVFEAVGPREQFWLLDRLAGIAGLELDLDDLARQSASNEWTEDGVQREVDRLLWKHLPRPYHEMRDKCLEHAFRGEE